MNSIEDIWAGVMKILSEQLTSVTIRTWFEDCRPIELRNGTFVLYTETPFKRGIIQERFSGTIRDALRELFSSDFELVILAGDELEDYVGETEEDDTLPEMDGYTFDNFIVGASNKFAHGAALGVVKNPGSKAYNPLFIYGNSGLGKTHLLKAIGSAIHEKDPKAKIMLVKGEEFLNEMVHALQKGQAEEFRQKYRQVDLFLMDDIQFISGKAGTQEEFFHTFESIYNTGHQIVVTSDRPPRDMATLDDRLRTRFEGGMMADIQAPDPELRIAIIRDKAEHMGLYLNGDVVSYIADKLVNNIRQIEGVVKKLSAYSGMGEVINRKLVDKAISDVIQSGPYIPTPEDIIAETARYFQVTPEDIKSIRRQKNIATARHVSAYLIRILTSCSLESIGAVLNRDHATINSSIKKIERDMKLQQDLNNTIRDVTSNINSRNR